MWSGSFFVSSVQLLHSWYSLWCTHHSPWYSPQWQQQIQSLYYSSSSSLSTSILKASFSVSREKVGRSLHSWVPEILFPSWVWKIARTGVGCVDEGKTMLVFLMEHSLSPYELSTIQWCLPRVQSVPIIEEDVNMLKHFRHGVQAPHTQSTLKSESYSRLTWLVSLDIFWVAWQRERRYLMTVK